MDTLKSKIMMLLQSGKRLTKYEIQHELKLDGPNPIEAISAALTGLTRNGRVERMNNGLYRIRREKPIDNQRKLF